MAGRLLRELFFTVTGFLSHEEIFSQLLAFLTSVDSLSNMSSLLLIQVSIPERVSAEEFLEWMIAEPQTIVWLPTLHRLAVSETGTVWVIPGVAKAPTSQHQHFLFRRLQSMSIFSILNHPCSFMVYYYLLGEFIS